MANVFDYQVAGTAVAIIIHKFSEICNCPCQPNTRTLASTCRTHSIVALMIF